MAQVPDYSTYIRDNQAQAIKIDYTNHRGERRVRNIIPIKIRFTATPEHKDAQWILDGFDLDKKSFRSYSFSGIHSFVK